MFISIPLVTHKHQVTHHQYTHLVQKLMVALIGNTGMMILVTLRLQDTQTQQQ